MGEIVLRILPVFLIMGFGILLKVLSIADDSWVEMLNKYGLYIGFPVLVFESLVSVNPTAIAQYLPLVRLNVMLLLSELILLTVPLRLFKVQKGIANTYIICSFFGNIAYLGYPIIMAVYPPEAFPSVEGQLSIVIAIYVVLLFTVGIMILELSISNRIEPIKIIVNIVKNPFIIALIAAALVLRYRIAFPPYVNEALLMIKRSASPVVLISLGIFMWRRIEIRNIWAHSLSITLLRLFALPFIFYAAGRVIGKLPDFAVSVVEAGMPLAFTPFALSSMYPLKRSVIVTAIVLSTALSIVSLPFFVSITSAP